MLHLFSLKLYLGDSAMGNEFDLAWGSTEVLCESKFYPPCLVACATVRVWLKSVCVQLYNNIYPFPLSQVVPLSQTDLATDPCRNTERSNQPDRGAQPARTNQIPAHWTACEHQTETGITGRDGRSGPHRISQPIGGYLRNPPVRDRTTGGNRDEAVQ